MNPNFKIVVWLYVMVFASLLGALMLLSYLHTVTPHSPDWIETIVGKLVSVLELVSGAAVGALSTAMAFVFRSESDSSKGVN